MKIDTTSVNTLMATIRTVFPDAYLGEDSERQVIIHTGLYYTGWDEDAPLQHGLDIRR